VRAGKFLNPRKGIYAKSGFSKEELACILYTPAYISLEYVLQKAGVVFQYDPALTAVSYLSRIIGDATCTGAILSTASTMEEIIAEVAAARVAERGNRRDLL